VFLPSGVESTIRAEVVDAVVVLLSLLLFDKRSFKVAFQLLPSLKEVTKNYDFSTIESYRLLITATVILVFFLTETSVSFILAKSIFIYQLR
jgi:hypothetical protein